MIGQILSATQTLSNLSYDHHSLPKHQDSERRMETAEQQIAVLFLTMFVPEMFPGIDTDLSKS